MLRRIFERKIQVFFGQVGRNLGLYIYGSFSQNMHIRVFYISFESVPVSDHVNRIKTFLKKATKERNHKTHILIL